MIPSPALPLIFPLFCENYFLSMSTRKSEKFDTLQDAYNKIVVVFSCLSQKIIDRTLCVAILSVSFMVKVLFLYFSFSLSLSIFSISITRMNKNNISLDKPNYIYFRRWKYFIPSESKRLDVSVLHIFSYDP